jgi:hypothetical protein
MLLYHFSYFRSCAVFLFLCALMSQNLMAQAPVITRIETNSRVFSGNLCLFAGAGAIVTIYGRNFTYPSLVYINNVLQANILWISNEQIAFAMSALATGFLEVRNQWGIARYCIWLGVDNPASSTRETDAISMDIYPNPSNNTAQVRYYLAQAGFVSIKIFDAQGKFLQTDVEELQQTGVHNLHLNLKALPSGTYTLVTEINQLRTTKPFVIVR